MIPEVGDPGQLPQQEHPQPVAGDGLPGAHGQAVDGPCGGEGGSKTRLLIGDDSPHQQSVQHHRRQRGQPLFPASGRQQGGDEGGQRSHDQIQQTIGTQYIGDEASGEQAPDRLRKEKGEYAQRLRKAALHDSEGQAEHGAEKTQYGVGGAHGGGPCQVLGL